MGKIMVLTFNGSEEKIFEKVISVLADETQIEPIQPAIHPLLSFPGLEIRLHQRRIVRDGRDISLTRYEYGVLCYLASYPGHVFTKAQIYEAVWNIDSDSCFNVVTNTISHLRAKIEPDRKNPTYIKTVHDGYKFDKEALIKIGD